MEKFRVLRGASELIDIQEFIRKWDESVIPGLSIHSDTVGITEDDIIAKEMDVPLVTVQELTSVCGESTLRNGDEPFDSEMLKTIPDNVNLTSVKLQKQDLLKREEDKVYKHFVMRKMKYKEENEKMLPSVVHNRTNINTRLQTDLDVILTVSVHNPMKPLPSNPSIAKLLVDQKFWVLGSQRLTELRDKINCMNDLAVAGDLSENPDDFSGNYAKDIFKSGFFYIEGVFYNDMREQDNRDNSDVIVKWASETGRGIGPLRKAKMEETTFADLKIRLGNLYLYQHQGDCEHLIMFNDIRLSNPGDIKDRNKYPLLTQRRRFMRTICRVCQIHAARWITYGSELAPDNPSFFCETCFKALNYDKEGKKIGNFSAHRFFDNTAMI